MVSELFPSAEIRGYTVWQQLGRHWARLLHRFGGHDDIWTYRIGVDLADGFSEQPLTIDADGRIIKTAEAMVLVKQIECSICQRKSGPIIVVGGKFA